MSRYVLLLMLNLPFILAGVLSTLTQYKMKRASRRRFIILLLFWSLIFIGLLFAEPLYNWLFQNNLTVSDALSLFDVIQITAIVILFYISTRAITKITILEKRVQDIHQELSIRLSTDESKRS